MGVRSLAGRLNIDLFIVAILAAVAVASVLPARGQFADVLQWAVIVAIAVLFFLYGARIHPREALAGLKHWRLHLVILGFTFAVFPLLGLLLAPVAPLVIGDQLYLGVLFLCLVPSTVQSSIAFTSMSRGNVPGAIVSASVSNLLGVFLTPLLVLALMNPTILGSGAGGVGGVHIAPGSIVDIIVQLLVPFVLGQLSRPLIGRWVAEHASPLKLVDRGSIVLVVYSAFSEGMREGIWHQVQWWQILVLAVGSVIVVAAMLWVTRVVAARLGFSREDAVAIQFCGTKKSLATGVPMAAVLFTGQPLGLIVLPLMVFHQIQLMMCAALASRYARADAG